MRISLRASFRTSGSRSSSIEPEDPLDELEDRDLRLVREVERLAGELRVLREPLGQQHVRGRAVLDVEVVAHELRRRSG